MRKNEIEKPEEVVMITPKVIETVEAFVNQSRMSSGTKASIRPNQPISGKLITKAREQSRLIGW